MAKPACCLTFTSEASQPLRVRPDFRRQDFDCYPVAKKDMTSAIDCPHPAFAQQCLHLVLAVEHGIDDRRRIRLEDLAIDRTEAHAVVVFCFAGSAVFHSKSTDCADYTEFT